MQIRSASANELPFLASIGVLSFAMDPIYSHFYPFRTLYPDDYYRSIFDNLRTMYTMPGNLVMVVEVSENDLPLGKPFPKHKVVAYFTAVYHGKTKDQRKWESDNAEKCKQTP